MSKRLTAINPDSLARPRGYSNGMKGSGDIVFVAGQIGWNREGRLVGDDLVVQFAQALDNVLDVVWAAGGKPENVARLTLYVVDKTDYIRRRKDIGAAYQKRMGKHYPAMALLEVKALLQEGALVEIEATAVV